MSSSGYFRWIFMCSLFLCFRGVWVQISFWGSRIDVLCTFVLDLDPSNSEFGTWLKDFSWNPSSMCELGRISIPLDSVGLRLQIHRYSISWRRFIITYDLVAISWFIWEIGWREGWGTCVVRGPVDGRSLVWWVIDNIVWTDSWLSIAGAGCSLTGVGAGEEQARKVVAGEASRCGEDK
jgi:hypothetical protein